MISLFGPYGIEWIAATAGAVSVYLSARENILDLADSHPECCAIPLHFL
jgi:hypothetical protein